MLVSLQGIVNQGHPSLYLVFSDAHLKWLNWYKEKGYIESYEEVKDIRGLIQKQYRKCIRGAIIYDPSFPVTINVATTLAGIEKGLICTEKMANEYNLPLLEDLRGRWKRKADAYEWMYKELWPKLNHNIIAFQPPLTFAQGDYVIQHKLFTFWISGDAEAKQPGSSIKDETAFAEKILKEMPPNTPVIGFPYAGEGIGPGELPGIALFTRFAKYDICGCPNISVHSAIKISKLKQNKKPPKITLQKDKTYVAFIISDGDNMSCWDTHHLRSWYQNQRGEIPINWNVMPATIDLIPGIMEYYYETASENDYFICAGSGIGYANPYPYGKEYPESDKILKDYIELLSWYMGRMDLTILNQYHLLLLFWGASDQLERVKDILSLYVESIPKLKAIYPDYCRVPGMNYPKSNYLLNGVPVFHALTQFNYLGLRIRHEKDVGDRVKELRRYAPKEPPGFINAFLVNWHFQPKDIEKMLKDAGPKFIPVRADAMADLYLGFKSESGVD